MTQVSDDVNEFNAGDITVQQLGERWAARTWKPIATVLRTVEAVAAVETDNAFGPEGSWWEVHELVAMGVLSRDDYFAISGVVDDEHAKEKAKMTRIHAGAPVVGHRHPTKIELSAGTDFMALEKSWRGVLAKLLKGWEEIKAQQILDLKDQIQSAVDNGSVQQVASVVAQTTGSELILKHMVEMLENSVVLAKQEAANQGVKLPTIDTSEVVRNLKNQAEGVGQIMTRSISNTAATQALTRYGVDDLSGEDVADAVGEHLEELSPAYAEDMLGSALNQAQNQGRAAVFQQAGAESIYASELLDRNTCSECADVDGTMYDSLEDAQAAYPQGGYSECLGGPRCRGTLVAVYDEASSADTSDDGSDSSS